MLVDQLIDAVWWDNPPRTAHKNIQVYIAHLRKFLADGGPPGQTGQIRYSPPGYQLRLTAAEVDALRFEELSRAGRGALRRGDAPAAADAMRQALGLWRGHALADLHASPVLRDEAARLEGRRLAAYEDWFDAELMLGNHVQVLDEIEPVVREHPLRERLRGQHLTALYRGGRQAEALAEYDNLRQLLAAELGLAPSPALQRLYQDILSGDPGVAGLRTVAVRLSVPTPAGGRACRSRPATTFVAHIDAPPQPVAAAPLLLAAPAMAVAEVAWPTGCRGPPTTSPAGGLSCATCSPSSAPPRRPAARGRHRAARVGHHHAGPAGRPHAGPALPRRRCAAAAARGRRHAPAARPTWPRNCSAA